MVGALSRAPKGFRFNYRSGHIPRLQVQSPVRVHTRGNQSVFLSPPSFLCKIRKNISLGEDLKRKKEARDKNLAYSCLKYCSEVFWSYFFRKWGGLRAYPWAESLTPWGMEGSTQQPELGPKPLLLPVCGEPAKPTATTHTPCSSRPLTSPGLMSSRAVTCKRKLFSGKEVSALGTQLWLPGS